MITIGTSAFASRNIIVDIKDIQSVVSLHNDDIGDDDKEGNLAMVSRHICEATGEVVEEAAVFTVPGDAFRDKSYMDWILSNKQGESALIEEYNDFIHK